MAYTYLIGKLKKDKSLYGNKSSNPEEYKNKMNPIPGKGDTNESRLTVDKKNSLLPGTQNTISGN